MKRWIKTAAYEGPDRRDPTRPLRIFDSEGRVWAVTEQEIWDALKQMHQKARSGARRPNTSPPPLPGPAAPGRQTAAEEGSL